MSLSKTLHPLLSTVSTQEDGKMLRHDRKIIDWGIRGVARGSIMLKPTKKIWRIKISDLVEK